jgi:hypothetical protein
MCGIIHPLPNTPSWRGAQLKKKAQGQLYLYLLPFTLYLVHKTKIHWEYQVFKWLPWYLKLGACLKLFVYVYVCSLQHLLWIKRCILFELLVNMVCMLYKIQEEIMYISMQLNACIYFWLVVLTRSKIYSSKRWSVSTVDKLVKFFQVRLYIWHTWISRQTEKQEENNWKYCGP